MKFIFCLFPFLFLSTSIALSFEKKKNPDIREEDESKKKKDALVSEIFSGLKFRSIGPALTSGRISDIAVNPNDRTTYYAAAASGGVWKTTNAGISWKALFDGQNSFSIGCITLDPNNPHIVWVGSGENNSQRSVSYGDGVYRSEDGGATWKNMGLKKSEHIGKIIIDPRNSSVVYVAAQGPLWDSGGDRGVYKTTDAGKTWTLILTISENTGVTDIVMDPRDPDLLIAASYQRRRHVWTLINGGPESKLYKTTNGGSSWDTLKTGLPATDIGRIGLAISPVNSDVIYAIIEAAENKGGFYRSTNRGASWEKRSEYVSASPQYYQKIVCDPKNVDRVYSLDTYLMVTDDGGKSFRRLGNRFRHVDDHAMWIDPENTNYYLVGGDGGIYESYDMGETWRFFENLPITQFYRVSVDNSEPFYYVYGGTQDNFSLGGPSRTLKSDGIMNEDWFITNGGDGFKTQIDPEDPNIIYAQSQYGGLVRFDRKSGERIGIQPQPGKDEEPFRWNWDSPLIISPHSHTRLYFAANILFKSDDRGNTWTAASGDLTRRIDRNTLPIMGKMWSVDAVAKNASTSYYGNIVALAESPIREGMICAGTDDGLIQITEDTGKNWRRIEKFPEIPERTYVSHVAFSQHDMNAIYATFDNHKNADFKPYILRSSDKGQTWTSIASNLPENGSVYVLVEDHINPKLLFVGTEFGVYVTIDGGKKWTQLKGGLPTTAVRDIAIHKRENDLVLATFGRGFYILDDYSSLRELSPEILEKENHIFPVKDALIYIPSNARNRSMMGETFYCAENPPFGATFTYYLKETIKTKKEKRREKEKESLKRNSTISYPTYEQLRAEDEEEKPAVIITISDESSNIVRRLTAPATKGMQRITWDLRYSASLPVGKQIDINKASGMLAIPGVYSVSVAKCVDGVITEFPGRQKFTAKVLNNTSLPVEDRMELVAFQKNIGELQRTVLGVERSMNELKSRLEAIKSALDVTPGTTPTMRESFRSIEKKTREIIRALNGDPTLESRNENQSPSIVGRLQRMIYSQWASSSAPTQTQKKDFEIVSSEIKQIFSQAHSTIETDLKDLEASMDSAGAPWTPGRIPRMR